MRQPLPRSCTQPALHLALEKPYMAGHDNGGMVAYALGCLHPEATRGVMILDVPDPRSRAMGAGELLRTDLVGTNFLEAPSLHLKGLVTVPLLLCFHEKSRHADSTASTSYGLRGLWYLFRLRTCFVS